MRISKADKTTMHYVCPKCKHKGPVLDIDNGDNFQCEACNTIFKEEEMYSQSTLNSLGRKISSLNRQLRVIKLADFGGDFFNGLRGDMQRIHDEVNTPGYKAKEQTCEEYLNGWDQGDLFSEMYWGKDFSSERAFEAMKYAAEAEGIHLTDADTWDYDGPMYEAYKNDPDKGLS